MINQDNINILAECFLALDLRDRSQEEVREAMKIACTGLLTADPG